MKARRGAPNSTTTAAASGRSSTGRAPVSKTGGWGFDSLRPCESWKVPRAPDPRPGREASEQRGTGLTVTWPWETSPDSDPRDGNEGELDSGQHQAGAGPALRERLPVAAATHGGDARDASAAAHASVGQLAGPPGRRPGPCRACRFESCPAYLLAYGGTSRWPATAAVSKAEGPDGRASSILAPSADGRRRRGGPAPGCYPGRGLGHEVRLLHLPPGSVGPAGVDARLSSGRSRVRLPPRARPGAREAHWLSVSAGQASFSGISRR